MPHSEIQSLIELYYWRKCLDINRPATNFTARLFELMLKADPPNRIALAKGFPNEHAALYAWEIAKDEREFLSRIEQLREESKL